MEASIAIGLVSLAITVIGMICGGVWIVATVKATTSQLVEAVKALTASTNKLAERIDDLEHDHADTRERLARLEGTDS